MKMGMAADAEFHVLAVDDSLIDRKLIERLLKTSSFRVTTVDSGSKALEFLGFREEDEQSNPNQPSVSPNNHQEMEVNLVITDYCMPGMTGYDLLKKMKESSSLRNIPVVIMSSENVPSRISRCLEEGAEDFLLKPVRLPDVHKLKPYMMRTKAKNQQKQDNIEMVHDMRKTAATEQEEERLQTRQDSSVVVQLETHQPPLPPQRLQQSQTPSSKRKAMEEALSPDTTRPRYSGLTVV